MELVVGIGLPVLFMVALFVVVMRVVHRAPLDLVEHLIPDAGGRYLHILGARTLMPEDGDSFTVYHHLLLDLDTHALYSGDKRRGENLELDSPFVQGSLAMLSRNLGTTLAFMRKHKKRDDDPDRESEAPADGVLPVLVRKGTHTDTERPKPVPDNAVIVWNLSESPARMAIEFRRDGATKARWPLRGRGEAPWLKRRWFPERGLLVMTYYRDLGLRSGVGLLIIDTRTPAILSNGFLRIGAPRMPGRKS